MNRLAIAGLLVLLSCKAEPDSLGPERTEPALIIYNSRIYDGCEAHIQLLSDKQNYQPTDETLTVLKNVLPGLSTDSMAHKVTLRFALTGKMRTLSCWEVQPKVGEMQVIDIQK